MKDIDNHVVGKWASKWKELGGQLNVGEEVIRNIQHDFERCCHNMLETWLDQTAHLTCTWKILINALDNVSSEPPAGLYNVSYFCT